MAAPIDWPVLLWTSVPKQCSYRSSFGANDTREQGFLTVPRTKLRTPELKERVLAVATELLAQEGAVGLTARSLAARAGTSAPAVYELFGDKAGVVRELYFEGFRMLSDELTALPETADAVADLWALAATYRRFVRANRDLAEVMFSRPFSDFSPGPEELAATGSVRMFIVGRVRRSIEAGRLRGDETDVAHVLVAMIQGMAFAEAAGRLGTSTESIERRWRLAIGTTLNGFSGTS
jgi:AcrR family transcriptional regulator